MKMARGPAERSCRDWPGRRLGAERRRSLAATVAAETEGFETATMGEQGGRRDVSGAVCTVSGGCWDGEGVGCDAGRGGGVGGRRRLLSRGRCGARRRRRRGDDGCCCSGSSTGKAPRKQPVPRGPISGKTPRKQPVPRGPISGKTPRKQLVPKMEIVVKSAQCIANPEEVPPEEISDDRRYFARLMVDPMLKIGALKSMLKKYKWAPKENILIVSEDGKIRLNDDSSTLGEWKVKENDTLLVCGEDGDFTKNTNPDKVAAQFNPFWLKKIFTYIQV